MHLFDKGPTKIPAGVDRRSREVVRTHSFFSTSEVETLLIEAGFGDLTWVQTLLGKLSELHDIEPVIAGTGRGAFLAVRASLQ